MHAAKKHGYQNPAHSPLLHEEQTLLVADDGVFAEFPWEEQSRLEALDVAECRQAKAKGRQVKLALRPSVKYQGPSLVL